TGVQSVLFRSSAPLPAARSGHLPRSEGRWGGPERPFQPPPGSTRERADAAQVGPEVLGEQVEEGAALGGGGRGGVAEDAVGGGVGDGAGADRGEEFGQRGGGAGFGQAGAGIGRASCRGERLETVGRAP